MSIRKIMNNKLYVTYLFRYLSRIEITILAGRPEGCPAKINLAGQTHMTSVVELLRYDAPTFKK